MHESDVAERLREVPKRAPARRVVHLGEKPQRARRLSHRLEMRERLILLPDHEERADEPETEYVERALLALQAVVRLVHAVAAHERAFREFLLHAAHRGAQARVVGGQEAEERNEQRARVYRLRIVGLNETLLRVRPAALQHVFAYRVALLPPVLHVAREPVLLRESDGAVERDPAHHLGVDEVPLRPAHLPYPPVRPPPRPRREVRHALQQNPAVVRQVAGVAVEHREAQRDLAEHVQLAVVRRVVADADGPRPLVALQVRQLRLGQHAVLRDAEEDLHMLERAEAVLDDPLDVRLALVRVADPVEDAERPRAVPQPGEAIVPVADAAQRLRQRRGRRGHDRARRLVDQQADGEVGADEIVAQVAVVGEFGDGGVVAPDDALHLPPAVHRAQGGQTLDAIDDCEFDMLALGDRELRDGALPAVGRGLDDERLSGDEGDGRALRIRRERAVADERQRRRAAGVVEPRLELEAHRDAAANAPDDADDLVRRDGIARRRMRHKVGDDDLAAVRRVGRLQDGGVVDVALRRGGVALRREGAVAAFGVVQDGGEHARRVETREARPINGAAVADERARVHIADDAVVVDGRVGHGDGLAAR